MKYIALLIYAAILVSCSSAEVMPTPKTLPLDPESAGEVRLYRTVSEALKHNVATVRIDSVYVASLLEITSTSLRLNAGTHTINVVTGNARHKTGCAIDINLKEKEIKYIEVVAIVKVITFPVPYFPNLGCGFKINEVEAEIADKIYMSFTKSPIKINN